MRATGVIIRQRRSHATDACTEQDLEVDRCPNKEGTQTWNGKKVTVPGDREAALQVDKLWRV